MKRKGIIIALCAMATTVLAMFASGCSCTTKIKQWKCEHDYGAVATKTLKEATCTEQGKELWTCRKCDKEKTVKTDKLPHAWDEGEVVEESTCLKTGLITYTCTVCESTKDEVTPLGDHKRVEVAQVDSTCETAGTTAYVYCQTCNGFLVPKKEIPALGHSEVKDAAVAATCTESGLTEGSHCLTCEKAIKAQTVVLATGHTPVTIEGYAATCDTPGKTNGSECSTCRAVLVAQVEIPPTHSPQTIVEEATCTTVGYRYRVECTACNSILVRGERIEPLEHTFNEGDVCESCGGARSELETLEYAYNSNTNAYNVVGIGTVSGTDIIIPATHYGLKIKRIDPSAFSYSSIGRKLTSIVISEGIESIGMSAFEGQDLITEMVIPEGVYLNPMTFYGMTALTEVRVLGEVNMEGPVFDQCTSLEVVIFEKKASFSGSYIFRGCTSLKAVVLLADEMCKKGTLDICIPDSAQIYVHSTVMAYYKSDENWNQYFDLFVVVEGTEWDPSGSQVLAYSLGEENGHELYVNDEYIATVIDFDGVGDWVGPY